MPPGNRTKLPLKRALEPRSERGSDDNDSKLEGTERTPRLRDQRLKTMKDDWRVERHSRDKGKAITSSPPPKKRAKGVVRGKVHMEDMLTAEDSSEELQHSASETGDDNSGDEDDDTMIVEEKRHVHARPKRLVKKETARKQYVEVDKRGHPHGKITSYLIEDVKSFAKGLNPCYGWNDQPVEEKQRFFDRLYVEWKVGGDQTKINPSWFPHYVTKTLINVRHNLMKAIDANEPKPAEVNEEVWNILTIRRRSQKCKDKSDQMRAISKAKGSKEAQMRAIEKSMIGELTLRLKRIPFEGEVKEATEKEYARRQAESRKPLADYAQDVHDMRASTLEMGGRLDRLEAMMQQLIQSIGENSLQQQVASDLFAGHGILQGNLGDAVQEDKASEENLHANAEANVDPAPIEAEDVPTVVAQDVDAEIDYLVDNLSGGSANENIKDDKTIDVQPEVVENVIDNAPTDVADDMSKDIVKDVNDSAQEPTDPYSLPKEVVPVSEGQLPVPTTQVASVDEVVVIPAFGTTSRSNRVTRSVPPTKPMKFAAPAKSTKGTTVKVTKRSPPKVADQAKKGEPTRKK